MHYRIKSKEEDIKKLDKIRDDKTPLKEKIQEASKGAIAKTKDEETKDEETKEEIPEQKVKKRYQGIRILKIVYLNL